LLLLAPQSWDAGSALRRVVAIPHLAGGGCRLNLVSCP